MSNITFIGSSQTRRRKTPYDIAVENGFVGNEQQYEAYTHGLSIAQVSLYKRSETTAPDPFSDDSSANAVYTFASGSVVFYDEVTPVGTENPHQEGWYEFIDGAYIQTDDTTVVSGKTYYEAASTEAGWRQSPYTDDGDLYVIYASANAKGAFDIILPTEWSTPVILSEEAAQGDPGYNVCIVPIYRASDSTTAPSLPTTNATFTFASKTISGLNNSWYIDPPTGDKVWMSTAVAISQGLITSGQGATATISYDKWSTPTVWKQKGDPGVSYWIKKSTTIISKNVNNSNELTPSTVKLEAKKNTGGVESSFSSGEIKVWEGTDTISALTESLNSLLVPVYLFIQLFSLTLLQK